MRNYLKIMLAGAALLFLAPAASIGQSQSVKQSGTVTSGHLACWTYNGIAQDCGTPTDPFATSFGVYGTGDPYCISNTKITTSGYYRFCFGYATDSSSAHISLTPFGGASGIPLKFIVNGTTYDFPFTIGGIVGPVSSTVGHLAVWNNTAGSILADVGALNALPVGNITPSTGAFTTIAASGAITPSQTNGIVGTTTNNNAIAGSVGEYIPSNVARGAGVSLVTATPTDITTIPLTAGDWDISWTLSASPAGGATVTQLQGGMSQTSSTNPGLPGNGAGALTQGISATGDVTINGVTRIQLTGTTTIYLVGTATFSGGSATSYGFIGARRAR